MEERAERIGPAAVGAVRSGRDPKTRPISTERASSAAAAVTSRSLSRERTLALEGTTIPITGASDLRMDIPREDPAEPAFTGSIAEEVVRVAVAVRIFGLGGLCASPIGTVPFDRLPTGAKGAGAAGA